MAKRAPADFQPRFVGAGQTHRGRLGARLSEQVERTMGLALKHESSSIARGRGRLYAQRFCAKPSRCWERLRGLPPLESFLNFPGAIKAESRIALIEHAVS